MDHYADDVAAVVKHRRAGRDARGPLDGRRRSGALYRAPRRGQSIQSGADQRGAAADGKTDANPQGTPKAVFDDFRAQLAANRAQFYYDVPAGPFYGYNRPGAKPSEAIIWNWWRVA